MLRENIAGYEPSGLCFNRLDELVETDTKSNCQILAEYFNKLLDCGYPIENFNYKNHNLRLSKKLEK